MGLPVAFAATAVKSLGVTLTKSPRFGGGDGPLFSTVNGKLAQIAGGNNATVEEVDRLRKTDADKVQWQKLWDEYVPIQPLTAQQRQTISYLDPGKAGIVARAPQGPGQPILASPGEAAPSPIQQVLSPIQAAIDQADATVREGVAQSVERLGVGGGATLAAKVRGAGGPLDTLIEFSQKPGGTIALAVGALVVVVLVARAIR